MSSTLSFRRSSSAIIAEPSYASVGILSNLILSSGVIKPALYKINTVNRGIITSGVCNFTVSGTWNIIKMSVQKHLHSVVPTISHSCIILIVNTKFITINSGIFWIIVQYQHWYSLLHQHQCLHIGHHYPMDWDMQYHRVSFIYIGYINLTSEVNGI